MSRPIRVLIVACLYLLPIAALAALGSYFVWREGWSFWIWWPMAACWSSAILLAWHWQRSKRLLPDTSEPSPLIWTDRDRRAWKHIEARLADAPGLSVQQLTQPQLYFETAEHVALELSKEYYPNASDPWTHLTLPEILAVIELAAHDLGERLRLYVPGSHLLTVRQMLQARQAADYYQKASNAYWAIAALFSPIKTSARFAASKLGLSSPTSALQQNVLVWFFVLYLQRLGHYLIEVYSGRLQIGVDRYRELTEPAGTSSTIENRPITITLFGQVKAGKSSLVNALCKAQKAKVDVLPATAELASYRLELEGITDRVLIQDTVGYAHEGPKADQLKKTMAASQESDLLLLVLHAKNPGREPDAKAMKLLKDWFEANPKLRMPPILGVVTHIDLLSPAMEWLPPYDWINPQRPKEAQIQQALKACNETFPGCLAACVPVCCAEGRIYGLDEALLPAMVRVLPESRAVGLLRVIQAEADAGKARRVLDQLLSMSKALLKGI